MLYNSVSFSPNSQLQLNTMRKAFKQESKSEISLPQVLNKSRIFWCFIVSSIWLLTSCGEAQPLNTVDKVDLSKYAGKWYEISKSPNSFEDNLTCVTAEYALREDGKISVTNRGYDTTSNKWDVAEGVAKRPDVNAQGQLKVSFFRPFYGDYYIMALEEDYSAALVGSPDRKYLWVLSRTETLDQKIMDKYVALAKELDFNVELLERTVRGKDC